MVWGSVEKHSCKSRFLYKKYCTKGILDIKTNERTQRCKKLSYLWGCSVNLKDSYVIPMVFHNLSGYDSHFVIQVSATSFKGMLTLLPLNKEKYISFATDVDNTNIKLRFINSFQFMPTASKNWHHILQMIKNTLLKIIVKTIYLLENVFFHIIISKVGFRTSNQYSSLKWRKYLCTRLLTYIIDVAIKHIW